MRHKVRDLGVFFCFALMLFTVTSCGKEVSDPDDRSDRTEF